MRPDQILEGHEMESIMSEWNPNLTMLPEQELLLLQLEKQIAERTDGRIRDLRVEAHGDGIVLSGRTTTYYMKQLASQIAMDAQSSVALQNSIEVI